MKMSEIKRLSQAELNEAYRIMSVILSQNNSNFLVNKAAYLTREEKEKAIFQYLNKNIYSTYPELGE